MRAAASQREVHGHRAAELGAVEELCTELHSAVWPQGDWRGVGWLCAEAGTAPATEPRRAWFTHASHPFPGYSAPNPTATPPCHAS
jgi:hypothetical protein